MRARHRLFGLLLLAAGTGTASAHEATESRYNYWTHVRPIFVKHCGGCHRAGGVAPMSLLDYPEAVPWVNAIKVQVLERTMPPWLPADGVGDFRHQRSLSAQEIDVLIDWTVGLTPEGEPAPDAQAQSDAIEAVGGGWAMGEPDWVLRPDEDIVIGEDDYEMKACRVLTTSAASSSIATAFEVKPQLAGLLRKVTIRLGSSCELGQPLTTWIPGQGSVALAGGAGQEIPAGAELAVELLYVKGWEDEGKRLTDRSEVGVRIESSASAARGIEVTGGSYRFDEDVELFALFPTISSDDDAPVRVDLIGPDGKSVPVLLIEDVRPSWVEKYVLSTPFVVPAGSELRMSAAGAWIDVRPASARPSADQ